jgi:hypothetical protein
MEIKETTVQTSGQWADGLTTRELIRSTKQTNEGGTTLCRTANIC